MRISSVRTVRFEPRFHGGGYASASGVKTAIHDRLVQVIFDDDMVSTAEIVRSPVWSADTVSLLEDDALNQLAGSALADLPHLVADFRRQDLHLAGLAAAVDTVFHDVVGRRCSLPISALLGGVKGRDVPEVLSLSLKAPEALAEEVRTRGRIFDVIQIKLGRWDTINNDLAAVRAVLEAMTPDQTVLADFNGALTLADALEALPAIRDPRLIWEEPCTAYQDNRELARRLEQPVMFDQCLNSPELFVQAISEGVARCVAIKPASLGGLTVSRFVRDLCAHAGVMMRIDGPWSGQIGAAVALHVALGAPPSQLFGSIDLTEAVDTPCDLVRRPAPGRIGPISGPGLGTVHGDLFKEVVAA